MFQSATFKLTTWYLLLLMIISLIFSLAVYRIVTIEVDSRLEWMQNTVEVISGVDTFESASSQIISNLLYINLMVFIGGGITSFLLARRTLRPIQEAHEAQSRFTSDASHELRTPLAAIKTEVEVALRDKSSSKQDYEDVLRSNLEEVEKLSRLSEMLLNLSKLDHNKLERRAVNLYDITKDALRRFGAGAKRVHINISKHSFVEGNEAALHELASILIDNALKYSPAGSAITINISQRNRQAYFDISNSGPGIDRGDLPHIFNRFYRADASRNKKTREGYGLGLALAKKIVELHEGELSVTSTPDESTSFTVMLPLAQKIMPKNGQ
jgi:signal transduction histidine kinase